MNESKDQEKRSQETILGSSEINPQKKGFLIIIMLQIGLVGFFFEEVVREYVYHGWDGSSPPYCPMTNITAFIYMGITFVVLFIILLVAIKFKVYTKWILWDIIPLEILFIVLFIYILQTFEITVCKSAKKLIVDALLGLIYGYFFFGIIFVCVKNPHRH